MAAAGGAATVEVRAAQPFCLARLTLLLLAEKSFPSLLRVDLLPAAPLTPPPAAIACRAAARQRPAALLSWVAVLNSPSIN